MHRLILAGDHGRPPALKDGPCLERLAELGFARQTPESIFLLTEAGRKRHMSEIASAV